MSARQTRRPPSAAPARPRQPAPTPPASEPLVPAQPARSPLPWPQLQTCVEERAGGRTPIPALDERAEAEADAVASSVVDRIGERPTLRPQADRLPASVSDAVAAEVGSVPDVRVHDDPLSAKLAASIGARAFTAGADVYLAPGEGGARLLAHEAAHAALHPQPSGDLVHAKLIGTFDALVAQGGKRSGKLKRVLGKHWDELLEAVKSYEAIEAKVVAGRRPLKKAQSEMLKLLSTMETQAVSWQKDSKTADRGEAHRLKSLAGKKVTRLTADPAAKAQRAQAVAMLLPRVRAERKALMDRTWDATLSLNAQAVKTVGQHGKGNVNVVQELTYDTGGGASFKGYFKADKGFHDDPERHELTSGISQIDPNYGARAVAMTRLDQLFQTHLLSRTEFATHNGTMGTVGETAAGSTPDKLRIALTDLERTEAGGGAGFLSLEDAELQRGLNRLQVLDAICGQLDRHLGNFFIDTDAQGNVKRITGIDLDMAFGKELKTGDKADPAADHAPNFVGMPSQVDAELGKRLLKLDDQLIRDAIGGLLSHEEVEATVDRFKWVRTKIAALDKQGLLVKEWNRDTMLETLGKDVATHGADMTSYMHNLASPQTGGFKLDVRVFAENALFGTGGVSYTGAGAQELRDLSAATKYKLRDKIDTMSAHRLAGLYWQGRLTPRGMQAIVMGLIETIINDHDVLNDLTPGVETEGEAVNRVLPKALDALVRRNSRAESLA